MKQRISYACALLATMLVCASSSAQLRLPRPSPKATVSQTIGVTDVSVTYSRPGVKGRAIWGELVPMDKVWRTGANEATTINFSTDVLVEGKKLSAGTYSLHTIPGKEQWTVIFNSVHDQWGSYSYEEPKDILRVKVKPQVMTDSTELLTFEFPSVKSDSAELALRWEKVRVPFTVQADTGAMALANARAAVAGAKPDDWRTSYQAANYSFQNAADWADASAWLDKSIGVEQNHTNLNLKARMLAKQGKTSEAITTAEKAIKLGQAATPKADTAATEKLVAEWKAAGKKKK